MILATYFFRQFIMPFLFGSLLFIFVMILDRLFDIIDLVFNKGIPLLLITKMLLLFIPSTFSLTLPMGMLLACLVTFGRLSEENELNAVRSAGISLMRVLWLPFLWAAALSALLIPFNTQWAPACNKAFRTVYEKILHTDPLVAIEPKKFFMMKNIRIYASDVAADKNTLKNVFVYQIADGAAPPERIFARTGMIEKTEDQLRLIFLNGQMQRFDEKIPQQTFQTRFERYQIDVPLKKEQNLSIRFRNLTTRELGQQIDQLSRQSLPVAPLQAEIHMRYALALAPLMLALLGIPLATVLKKGGKGFSMGIAIAVLFLYYLFLLLGLSLAERRVLPPWFSLWMGNIVCGLYSFYLVRKLLRQ